MIVGRTVMSVRRLFALGVLVLAAALAASSTASAGGLSCDDDQGVSHPFAPWGDVMAYKLIPNGDLESGSSGWELSGGAAVAEGNEPFYVGSDSDRYSLLLQSGSSATSPVTCVNALDPTLRFFLVNTGSPRSRLKVEVLYKTLLGFDAAHEVALSPLSASETWQPSPALPFLADVTGVLALDGTTTDVRFRFTPEGRRSAWRIDGIYVDPLFHE